MSDPFKAVLFDLDGTLLDVDIRVFLPHYIQALADYVGHLVPPERFIPCLTQASEAMLTNDGRASNQAVFAQTFYPAVGKTREELEPVFLRFYAHEYPKLRRLTRRKPEARRVVQLAFNRGYRVAIATNPLFPRTAIEQRLEWAGVADYAYDQVTTYENSCAAKPNPLYFEQVLQAIDCPPEASLMVGDEDMDMAAAHIGCTTFLVPSARTELEPDTPEPTYRGTLADLLTLFQDEA